MAVDALDRISADIAGQWGGTTIELAVTEESIQMNPADGDTRASE